jgi:hypothetical protein
MNLSIDKKEKKTLIYCLFMNSMQLKFKGLCVPILQIRIIRRHFSTVRGLKFNNFIYLATKPNIIQKRSLRGKD